MDDNFPSFYYNSNACWGRVNSFEDLARMAKFQLAENNGIRTLELFLIESRQVGDRMEFGTYSEHDGKLTLWDFLSEHVLLNKFIDYYEEHRA